MLSGTQLLKALAKNRSFNSYLKIEPAVQLLKEYIISEKVVMFAHHRKVVLGLVEAFGNSCVHIIGGIDSKSREEAVDRFQNDASCHLFVGSIRAAGLGLTLTASSHAVFRAAGLGLTLTASSHVVFLELDWSPAIMDQAMDHCHRVGQQDSVQVDYFVFKGTIDECMARQLAQKSHKV